jgi:hypothetical protein
MGAAETAAAVAKKQHHQPGDVNLISSFFRVIYVEKTG